MKTIFKSLLLVSALAMPLASVAADGDPISTKASDTLVTAKVKAAFAKDKLVSASDIKVETDSDGLVRLSGAANSSLEAEQAIKIARNVKGVTAVKNDIVVAQ